MAEQISIAKCPSSKSTTTVSRRRSLWPSVLRWIPTSTDHILASEKRLLSLVKWFRSSSNSPRFINTVTFDSKKGAPTLVLIHGYAASQGFFFKNFDYLAEHFQVIAIDQLGQAHPEHVQHLILVEPAGFSSESDSSIEWLTRLRETWKGAILNRLSESNFTPQKIVRFVYLGLGPWGPKIVHKYTATRFNPKDSAEFVLAEEQIKLLTD
ncbi:hypothetical protein J1N35_029963 [Gossypium stocksii]|uniref:AB hydrolase-1 domain-containing protein n=1 Tax=Gossypium stocksii TaxID=47602 RepID=A0A9D3UYX3_9ROSI|nr:hypothetical protein J1N35_029963 [Gossypium stocksii]